MNVGETQGCTRKIRTGELFANLITSAYGVSPTHPGPLNPKILTLTEDEEAAYEAAYEGEGKRFLIEVSDEHYASIQKAQELNIQFEAAIEYPCCTIIHGDCRDHLWRFPARSFDLIVTDPPYGISVEGWQEHHAQVDWDEEYPFGVVQGVMSKFWDLPRLGSYFFCGWKNLWDHEKRTGVFALPKPKSMLVWHKLGAGAGLGSPDEHRRDYEMAFFYPGPDHKFKSGRPKSVLACKPTGNNDHPTQKPVELIKEILSWYDCETVLDPYMGSGTTAVAAIESGKHFFGFEANEEYYRKAMQRIAEAKADVG